MLSPKFWRGLSGSHQMDGYLTHPRWSFLRHGARGTAELKKAVCCRIPDLRKKHARLSLPVAKARGGKKEAKRPPPRGIVAPPPMRQCQAESQTTVLSHIEDFAGRLAALEVSGVAPIPTPRGPGPAMLGIPTASRKTSGPALLCSEQTLRPAAFVLRSSQVAWSLQKVMCLLVKPRTCRSSCETGSSSGQAQKLALTRGGIRSGSGCGVFRNGAHRSSQRRRIRRGRASETGQSCPSAAHSTHPSQVPWSERWSARDESTGRPSDSHQGILELATSRKGSPPSSLWSLPNSTKSHRDDRRSPRRGKNRRVRSAARGAVPDICDTRV